ncbi:MAG: winged helix-turn-helix domain-containing protein [Candidatus Bathyarchaeota archaeon]|nr:MAG: winged helix-turn-helix domain-containing protein [Candidatus Bathyarchaeota archaeon]
MTSLIKIFGSKAQTKLVQHLLEHKGRIYNQIGLSRRLNLSPSTVARVIIPLIEEGIIKYDQISGQMKIIALNVENEKVNALIDFYDKLSEK